MTRLFALICWFATQKEMAGLVDELPAVVLIQTIPCSFSNVIGRSFPDVIVTDIAGAFPGTPDE